MISEEILRHKKLEELTKTANVSDEELQNMSYKDKQKVFKAKNMLCKIVWKSGEKGTLIKQRKRHL